MKHLFENEGNIGKKNWKKGLLLSWEFLGSMEKQKMSNPTLQQTQQWQCDKIISPKSAYTPTV